MPRLCYGANWRALMLILPCASLLAEGLPDFRSTLLTFLLTPVLTSDNLYLSEVRRNWGGGRRISRYDTPFG